MLGQYFKIFFFKYNISRLIRIPLQLGIPGILYAPTAKKFNGQIERARKNTFLVLKRRMLYHSFSNTSLFLSEWSKIK
jgi:hypothetical protein